MKKAQNGHSLGPQLKCSSPNKLQIGTACVQTTIYRLAVLKLAISKKCQQSPMINKGGMFLIGIKTYRNFIIIKKIKFLHRGIQYLDNVNISCVKLDNTDVSKIRSTKPHEPQILQIIVNVKL